MMNLRGIKGEISQSNKLWATIKDLTGANKKIIPRLISDNNKMVTSLKTIANIANNHFVNKLIKIRESFTKHKINHINILERIIDKPNTQFKLEPISMEKNKENY